MLTRRAASILAIVAAMGVLGPSRQANPPDGFEPAWRAFVQASGEHRATQARFSGFPHHPWRSSRGTSITLPLEQRAAALDLERTLRPDARPSVRARVGVARVITGDVTAGIEELERARANGAATPSVLSDLAAAYLVRTERSPSSIDLARALDAAQRAILQDASYAPAWFNQAIALERLNLSSLAAESWTRGASSDTPAWRDEALDCARRIQVVEFREERLNKLAKSIAGGDANDPATVSGDPDLTGEVIERVLLRRWAAAVQNDDFPQAAAVARRASRLAEYVRASTGDPYLIDVVRQLTSAADRSGSARSAARGWLAYVQAIEFVDADRIADADALLALADRHLRLRAPSAMLWIDIYRAGLERLRGSGAAGARLERVRQRAAQRRYSTTLGRALWQSALLSEERGDIGAAFTGFQRALALFEKVRDRESAAVLHMLLASLYAELGETDTAWTQGALALDGVAFARRIRRDPILSGAALLSAADGLHAAATVFRDLPIREARAARSTLGLVFLLNDQAADLHAIGIAAPAMQAIEEAKRLARELDPGTVQMAEALLHITEADLTAERFPDRAVDLLSESVRLYEARGAAFARATTQLRRGQLLARLNKDVDAVAAFRDGVAYTEKERRSLDAFTDVASLQAARWDLYAELAELYWRRNDRDAAFDFVQRGRAAAVNRGAATETRQPPQFTAGNLTIVFAIVRSDVLVWAKSATVNRQFLAPIAADDLRTLVERHAALLRDGSQPRDFEGVSRRLFDVLFAPIREELGTVASVTIVPDGVLCELAFGALIDGHTQRFLIEQVAINAAPALPSDPFVPTSTPDERRRTPVLVVGNPDRSTATGDRLPSLPYADAESRAVAALYERPALVSGPAATRRSVLSGLPNAHALHFSGHAVATAQRPELSRLLLTPDRDDTLGALFARDIDPLRLQNVEVVVLAACGTASGRVARGAGVISLARAFLYAGAHSVIATLWPIDDQGSGSLFVAFHRQWIRGLAPAEALRAAQLEAIAAHRAPRDWAAVAAFVR